jgi:hypothetical protein
LLSGVLGDRHEPRHYRTVNGSSFLAEQDVNP